MADFDRADLRGRARLRADHTDGSRPTDAQYNIWINEAGREVHSDLIGAGLKVNTTTQSITANGAASYSLNSGNPVFGVTAVHQLVGGQAQEVRPVNPQDLASLRSLGVFSGIAGFYEVRLDFTTGLVIEFLPRPTGGSFTVDYILPFTSFAADGTLWRGPTSSDELIVLRVAAKALRNEGETADAGALDDEYQPLFAKVMNRAGWIDMRAPAGRIRNVEGSMARDPFDHNVVGY